MVDMTGRADNDMVQGHAGSWSSIVEEGLNGPEVGLRTAAGFRPPEHPAAIHDESGVLRYSN